MNSLGQTPWEAQERNSLLQFKSMTRLGNNVSIIGLSECRWNTFGEVSTATGGKCLYSGKEREEDTHMHGVGLMLSKDAARSLLEWEPVSERIITARFASKGRNITIIQCYAPTNLAETEEKEQFYQQLEAQTRKSPKRDIQIVMGDMNAKIGKDNTKWTSIMEKEGLGEVNENGALFADFCTFNELIIGGSLFPHKPIHKATWISSDQSTENQIDHITIARKWRKLLLDVRVKRGADIDSYHHLLIGEFRLKLAAKARVDSRAQRRFDSRKLRDPQVKKDAGLTLKNRFSALAETEDVEEEWRNCKKSFIDTCEHVLGYRKKERKDWIADDT